MYIPLIVFVIVVGIHLFFCWTKQDKWRKITKLMLMPLLLLSYLIGTAKIEPALILALVCGFLGDFFLTKEKDPTMFVSGLMSFLAGHAFYTAVILGRVDWSRGYIAAILAVIVGAAATLIFNYTLKDKLHEARIPCFIYSSMLCLVAASSLTLLVCEPGLQTALLLAGSLLFVVSDSLLCLHIFSKPFKHGNFYVMATYIPAQTLMIAGLIIR